MQINIFNKDDLNFWFGMNYCISKHPKLNAKLNKNLDGKFIST